MSAFAGMISKLIKIYLAKLMFGASIVRAVTNFGIKDGKIIMMLTNLTQETLPNSGFLGQAP